MHEPGLAADDDAVAHVIVERLDHELRVGGDDGHHLARVRRLQAGEPMTAADGRGEWRPYEVAGVDDGVITLRARGETRREPELEPGLAVAFALTKGAKPEVIVRQLTELGVDSVVPVHAERSVSRPSRSREPAMVERWRRVAREAAQQSRRARVPEVAAVQPLGELAGRADLVVAERARGGPPLADPPATGSWTLLVGPEGGFSAAELRALASAPRLAVGVHVLRAETAAVAAAALLTARRPGGTGTLTGGDPAEAADHGGWEIARPAATLSARGWLGEVV